MFHQFSRLIQNWCIPCLHSVAQSTESSCIFVQTMTGTRISINSRTFPVIPTSDGFCAHMEQMSVILVTDEKLL